MLNMGKKSVWGGGVEGATHSEHPVFASTRRLFQFHKATNTELRRRSLL